MDVCGFEVEIVMMTLLTRVLPVPMSVGMTMTVRMIMPMMVCIAKDQRADHIDKQAQDTNGHGLLVLDGSRRHDPIN